MNLLFWNIHKKNLNNAIVALIKERNIDIALFAECKEVDIEQLVSRLEGYERATLPDSDNDVHAIYKKGTTTIIGQIRIQSRMLLFKVVCGEPYMIVGLHLAAKADGSERRREQIRIIMGDINEEENSEEDKEERYKDRTIVIGDFNANPFDIEMIGHSCFNAVLYTDLIQRQEIVKWVETEHKRFYNPALQFFSEATKMYGSFYFDDENRPLYWYCLDQVLLRKPLIPYLKKVEYIKTISGTSLLTNRGLPDKNCYSDHLPLLVVFDKKESLEHGETK